MADTITLTDASVRAASVPEGKSEVYLREPSGLALRVRRSGAKTFVFFSTRPGMRGSHKITIGPFPKLKVADAKKRAKILAGQHAAGIDLIAQKQSQQREALKAKEEAAKAAQEAASVVTSGALVAERIEDGKDKCPYAVARRDVEKIVKWKAELSAMRRNLSEHFRTDIREIKRRHVMEVVNSLNAAGKRGASADLWKHSFGFFGWCVEEDYIDANPLTNARRKRVGSRAERLDRKENEMGRDLADGEMIAVWRACDRLGSFGLLTRFCLLAGTRRGEAAQLKWSDVKSDRIEIDARNTKKGRAHSIPKTALIDAVLEDAAKFRRASSDYVFPPVRHRGPFTAFPMMIDRLVQEAGTERFGLHDLRRTCRSVLSRLGFNDQQQRACIGQLAPAFDRKYNKHDHWNARAFAFERYHQFLGDLITGKPTDNVIAFSRANNPEAELERQLEDRLREHRAQALAAG